jgi:transposase
MARQCKDVILTPEDRKKLEIIVKSNKSSTLDKLKAKVLLLTDISELGPKLSCDEAVEQLKISPRSIGRIREAYAQNSCVQYVFSFPGLSDQSKFDDRKNPNSLKKKHVCYVESENKDDDDFLIELVKCKVTLTKEEREKLESIIKEGKQTIRKFNRAKILLLADEGPEGPAMSDEAISERLEVSKSTVQRVRKLLLTKGQMEDVLNFNHQNAGRPSKFDGKAEAALVAQVCSKPPAGRCKWTLRLLADRLVELKIVDSITHGTISNTLKKMKLSLGSVKNG